MSSDLNVNGFAHTSKSAEYDTMLCLCLNRFTWDLQTTGALSEVCSSCFFPVPQLHLVLSTFQPLLIQSSATVWSTTQARNLHLLDRELVIVRDFLIHVNVSFGINDDLLESFHSDDFCVTVGLQTRAAESENVEQSTTRTPTGGSTGADTRYSQSTTLANNQ